MQLNDKNVGSDKNVEKKLSLKELKLAEALMAGYSNTLALGMAGYSPKSTAMINKVKPLLRKLRDQKESELLEKVMSKGEISEVIAGIIKKNPSDRVKLQAITVLSRLFGLDAPIKVDQTSSQNVVLKLEEYTEGDKENGSGEATSGETIPTEGN